MISIKNDSMKRLAYTKHLGAICRYLFDAKIMQTKHTVRAIDNESDIKHPAHSSVMKLTLNNYQNCPSFTY